jgi:hypothetical protein
LTLTDSNARPLSPRLPALASYPHVTKTLFEFSPLPSDCIQVVLACQTHNELQNIDCVAEEAAISRAWCCILWNTKKGRHFNAAVTVVMAGFIGIAAFALWALEHTIDLYQRNQECDGHNLSVVNLIAGMFGQAFTWTLMVICWMQFHTCVRNDTITSFERNVFGFLMKAAFVLFIACWICSIYAGAESFGSDAGESCDLGLVWWIRGWCLTLWLSTCILGVCVCCVAAWAALSLCK